jgi:Hint domain
MSQITGAVTEPVKIGAPAVPPGDYTYYSSPLQIESGGSVDIHGSSFYGKAAVSNVTGSGAVTLDVYGGANTIVGGNGSDAVGAGAGLAFTVSSTVLDDAGIQGGNVVSGIDANGGVGVSLSGGSLTIGDGTGGELHGGVHGGSGYGVGHVGGDGVDATSVTIINGEYKSGVDSYGTVIGGAGEGGANGGIGVSVSGGTLDNGGLSTNPTPVGSTIEGGISTLGAGGDGVVLQGGADLNNYSDIAGGQTTAGGGNGGIGVKAGAGSIINNSDSIIGGSSFGGTGGDAVDLAAGAQLTSTFLIKGGSGPAGGGIGVDLVGQNTKLTNDIESKIYGGSATTASGKGGDGVAVGTGTSVTSYGRIYGGGSAASGHGGYGVYLDGGDLTSTNGISGGPINGNSENLADAVKFGASGGTLTLGGAYWKLNGYVTGFNTNSKIILEGYPQITEGTKGGHYYISDPELLEGFIPVPRYIEFSGTYGEKLSITDVGGNTVITLPSAPCYCRGTRISTARGETPVEELQVGDAVVTSAGALRPVRWLGHRRLDCTKYSDRSGVWPILIRAGAFAEHVPVRDLLVSPGHSICVNGSLIQAVNLVNGVTVLQQQQDEVEYWHVELDSHDILLAEGLPAESYLDTGNRTAFVNGGQFLQARPDFGPKHWTDTCLPLVMDGEPLVAAKQGLLETARTLGFVITGEADLHVLADGMRIDSISLDKRRYAFTLPAGCTEIQLCARTFIPAYTRAGSRDLRELGVCVGRLQLNGDDVSLDDETFFATGWHRLEQDASGGQWRWSHGRAPLPAGTRLVVVDINGEGYYWSNSHADSMQEAAAPLKLASAW